ncbi:outer membrane assembly protein AsmA [Symbiopectobacterium purcellii]|uniref:outer membrane assembly protein AsmA n=1 Tax=Symbiopectobacterium purcellii TaxID=2871826 RepID=UPI003F830946
MKRVLTTLAILLVVLAVGMTALVMLVNPNDFRAYMVSQVDARSGYRLQLEGDLRWHVWPQLSILSGGMSLTAPGAAAPIVSAENMRLDVKLWPLLSHRLEVKQVMLKGAVVRLTPESEAHRSSTAPIAPAGSSTPEETRNWRLAVNQLKIVDSLLILQRGDDEQLNVRDINLTLEESRDRQLALELTSRINRDQRDLAVSLQASLYMQHYPQQIDASIEQFQYQLQGAGIPAGGISGSGSLQASYQQAAGATQPEKVTVSQFTLAMSDSQLSGNATATLGDHPEYTLDINAARLNLDALLGSAPTPQTQNATPTVIKTVTPVVSTERGLSEGDALWQSFSAQLALQVDTFIYRGLTFSKLNLNAVNQAGVLTLSSLQSELNGAHIALTGKMDAKATPKITLQPTIEGVSVEPLTVAFALPQTVSGKLSLKGQFSGDTFSLDALMRQWRGNAALSVDNLRFQGVNIQQMIQLAVVRNNSNVQALERYDRYTDITRLTGNADLNAGKLRVSDITGQSALLSLTGTSQFDLPAQQCDMNFNVRITDGWRGNEQLVDILKSTSVPLRIYGPINNLSYQLQVDQLLRKRLQDEMKKRLNEWADKNQQSQTSKGLKQLLDKL